MNILDFISRYTNDQIFRRWIFFTLLSLIIGFGIFLRLHHLKFMEFKHDEALNAFKSLALAQQGVFPLSAGVSSLGCNEPPVFIYLVAPPFLVSSSPVIAAGYIAIWNVLGVGLCFYLTRYLFNTRAALCAAALYAANPWSMLFSRKIWTQNLLAPFVMLFLTLFLIGLKEKNTKMLIAAMPILGILLQLHLSAAFVLVGAAAILWIYRRNIMIRPLLIGCLLMAATFLPYLALQIQTSFADVTIVLKALESESTFHLEAFYLPFQLMTTRGFEYTLGQDFSLFEKSQMRIILFDVMPAALFAFSLLAVFWTRNLNHLCLAVWVLGGMTYLSLVKTELPVHYFLAIMPVGFILAGIGIDHVAKLFRCLAARAGIYLAVTVICIYQIAFGVGLLEFVKAQPCVKGDYGPPYAYRLQKVQDALKQLGPPTTVYQLNRIHSTSAYCEKCDYMATAYIVKQLTSGDLLR